MPLRILAARKIAAANLIQVLSVAGMFGMFFLGALYLRRILGYSPLQIGLAFPPVAVVMGALSVRYTDRLAARFGARATLVAGLALIAAALLLFAQAPVRGGYAIHDLPVMLLMGAGAGLAFPALMTVAMSGATPADAGLASGLVNTTAQVGGALGLAVLDTVSAGRTSTLAARGDSVAAALTSGYHLAFWIAAGLVAAAIAVAGTVLRPGDWGSTGSPSARRLRQHRLPFSAGSASLMVLIGEVEPAVSDPLDELADVISGGGEDFGAFAAARWPEFMRLAYELTGDQSAATELAQAALARTRLAWWRVSRSGDPDAYVRRILIESGTRVGPRPGRTPGGSEPQPPVQLDQIEQRARTVRSRRARIIAVPVAAGLVAAGAWLIAAAHPAARPAHLGPPAAITNSTADLGAGVFAQGTADGRQWELTVQDIADPGYRCLPGVSVNGNDADPLFADPQPLRQSPVGNPAFVTLGSELPGAGLAFIEVPADADWLWLDPVGGFQLGVAPVTVTACGQQFRLVGFAYPLAATLRMHLSFRDRPEGSYTAPFALSALQASPGDPRIDGIWQGLDAADSPVATGAIASGNAFGVRWSIRVTFGTAGDCYSISTSPPGGNGLWQTACGPISTPEGPSTIMVLPLGSPRPGVIGVGYAISVGTGTDHLTAELSDGSNVSARPLIVDGRKYAAFFTPGALRMFWLNWVDATGRPIAGTTGLPAYGYVQFWPSGVPAMKTEAWSTGWSN